MFNIFTRVRDLEAAVAELKRRLDELERPPQNIGGGPPAPTPPPVPR